MGSHREIHQRDDGLFDIVAGDAVIGPFRSRLDAETIVRNPEPERRPPPRPRRWKVVREVRLAVSA